MGYKFCQDVTVKGKYFFFNPSAYNSHKEVDKTVRICSDFYKTEDAAKNALLKKISEFKKNCSIWSGTAILFTCSK